MSRVLSLFYFGTVHRQSCSRSMMMRMPSLRSWERRKPISIRAVKDHTTDPSLCVGALVFEANTTKSSAGAVGPLVELIIFIAESRSTPTTL